MLILETERLRLRWLSTNDADFILELMNDPSWIRFIGNRGLRTVEDAGAYIEDRLVAAYRRDGFGLWLVERRSDGERTGICGLMKRDSLPHVDIGFAFLPRFWGQGYAKEAAMATLAHAQRTLKIDRLLAITSPDNYRSIKVLSSIGMQFERATRLSGEDRHTLVFVLGGPERPQSGMASTSASDKAQIDALVSRFFAAFTNKQSLPNPANSPGSPNAPNLGDLPGVFASRALIVKVSGTRAECMDLDQFVEPRAALLRDGRLTGFEEFESDERTDILGNIAQRRSSYRKFGVLNGTPFEGSGRKLFQFIRTDDGWKISAFSWEDDP